VLFTKNQVSPFPQGYPGSKARRSNLWFESPGGGVFTRILMHSSQSFTEYYKDLLTRQLVKEIINNKGKKHITLTDKGFKYLEKYKYILGFIDEFEL